MSDSVKKTYIDAQTLLEDSFRLGVQIFDSGFRPSFIVGVWRGGTPVGIAVQELLEFLGVETDHIAVRTSYYTGIEERASGIRVHGMQYVVDNISADDGLLVVDDVFDTGSSIDALIEHLQQKARRNTPEDIRIATPYYKPSNNRTQRVPDFFVHESDDWLVFPHELRGLTIEEIRENKLGIGSFADRLDH